MPRINSKQFYKNAIKKHGITPEGVCWLSYTHQYLRFEKILELLPENMSPLILADAGCGFGDFYLFLQKNTLKIKKYIGIDSLEDMCDIAAQRTEATIMQKNIINEELPLADYYICSGALNLLTPFETHLFIQNCYKASKKALIFNALYGDKESQTYNYLSKKTIEQIALTLEVKEITYLQDYLNNDITVKFSRG